MRRFLFTSAVLIVLLESILITWIFIYMEPIGVLEKVGLFSIANILGLILYELVFRLVYFYRYGEPYSPIKKVPISNIHIQAHPFLSYEYKECFPSPARAQANYPLHKGKFSYPKLQTGNLRHNDGLDGSRVMKPKQSENEIKVVCLGASTTGNYIQEGNNIYSYPILLEKKLQEKYPDKEVVVHNCGQGGWTSAEVFINFALKVIDLKPDFVVIYHAYNDLPAGLTPNFRSDYSHFRRNFGEVFSKMKISQWIPSVPLHSYNFVMSRKFPWMNPRSGLLQSIKKGNPDLNSDFKSISTLARNLEHIVHICNGNSIKVILSTFAHYMFDEVSKSEVHIKYSEGLKLENEAITLLAKKLKIPFVDNSASIPHEEKYFVDTIHFSPLGMDLLAQNFSDKIVELIGDN